MAMAMAMGMVERMAKATGMGMDMGMNMDLDVWLWDRARAMAGVSSLGIAKPTETDTASIKTTTHTLKIKNMNTAIELTPTQLKTLLRDCDAARPHLNPFIIGQPGVGKSAVVAEFAAESNREFIDLRLAYYAPQDVIGFPHLVTEEDGSKALKFSRPAFWPKTENPVIALEEFSCASKAVQNVALQLLNDRRVGEFKLPDGAFIVLLGNRPEDKCHLEKLSSAVMNRIACVRARLDLDSWIKWAFKNGIDPFITAFMQFRPDLLSTFDGAKWDGVSGFASPRTWEKASSILKVCTDRVVRHALLEGVLGQGAAAEVLGFLSIYESLPDLNQVLRHPDTAAVPTDPSVIYATCAGLAKLVTVALMDNYLSYLERMPKEFAVFSIRTAINYNTDLQRTAGFTRWVVANQAVLCP